ncbi:MAG: hypothetical protein JOS17DRAFT_740520 [Linnemannia elongata]|nr:MAG: hypothetical protein JOS17DRAFT_740520 [Linnemannia elongata]
MKQSCLFFFPLPSFLCSFHLSFYTSFPPSVLIVCFVSRETFFLCSGFHTVLCPVLLFTLLVARRWYMKSTEDNAFETNGVSL